MRNTVIASFDVHAILVAREEIAFIDVREEGAYCKAHPRGAASLPLSRLELEVLDSIPRRATPIAIYDEDGTLVSVASQRLRALGYTNVRHLDGGLAGWEASGYPLTASRRPEVETLDMQPDQITHWLEKAEERYFPERVAVRRSTETRAQPRPASGGVTFINNTSLEYLVSDPARTHYGFDLRESSDSIAGHILGFRGSSPATLLEDVRRHAVVHGARIILEGSRDEPFYTAAEQLSQWGWDVCVLNEAYAGGRIEGPWTSKVPPLPSIDIVSTGELASCLHSKDVVVIDLAKSREYSRGHIPGAWFAIRSDLPGALCAMPWARDIVLTSEDGLLAALAAAEIEELTGSKPRVLHGGTAEWRMADLPIETNKHHWASFPSDATDIPDEFLPFHIPVPSQLSAGYRYPTVRLARFG